MSETIKSQTNCPACGSDVEVGGETTHFYIPKNMYSEEEVLEIIKARYVKYIRYEGREEIEEWFKQFKK